MTATSEIRDLYTRYTDNDQLRLTPQGWRFAYRQVRIDWQSPTSMSSPMATR